MCHAYLRHPFDYEDVANMIAKLYADRVQFHDGTSEIAPNLTVHRVGGHSKGLQVVRVLTRRGWVVLGSDASHFYANFEQYRPFPVLESASDMLAGYDAMRRLATSLQHIVPGHDPLVLERYPAARPGLEGIVAKRADAPYVSRRSETWLKLKCKHRQEFVVCGYNRSQRRSGTDRQSAAWDP